MSYLFNSRNTYHVSRNTTNNRAKIILIDIGTGSGCPSGTPFIITFEQLSGKMNFVDSRCTSLTITLTNSKTAAAKSLIIEKVFNLRVNP